MKVVLKGVLVSEAPHGIIEDQEELGPCQRGGGHRSLRTWTQSLGCWRLEVVGEWGGRLPLEGVTR